VPWTNTGNEKTRVSVAFAAASSGYKLAPVILIPRKKPLKDFDPPNNVRVVYGTTGNFNFSVINNHFVKRVLNPYRLSIGANKLHLVLDQATCHLTKEVKDVMKQHKIEVQYVPKRLTNLLQPADISWMRTLKAAYHVKWNDWMLNSPHTVTVHGNLRSPGIFIITRRTLFLNLILIIKIPGK